jgi:molecular chaperone Hsp33
MSEKTPNSESGLEVRTYFVREHNALLARADFGDLYIDYYLHLAQAGLRHAPRNDELLKETLAALTLHCASRPHNETTAFTVHCEEPMVNLFASGDNNLGTVTGHLFTENIKSHPSNLLFADIVRGHEPLRRSTIEFTGTSVFAAVEQYYRQSEQRPARYFQIGEEDFVMISAQPDCDLAWFEALTDSSVASIDQTCTLRLLEQRRYRWECGCNQDRMFTLLAPVMRADPEQLFGNQESLRISCPRCGARHTITREALEAFIAPNQ